MKKRAIFTLLLLLCAVVSYSIKVSWAPQFKVGVATSRVGDIDVNIKANGKIEEASSTEVYSPVESIVSSLNVREGDYVEKGSTIAELADGTSLKSPVSGTVRTIAVVGMPISTIRPLAVIGNAERLIAKVNIPEEQAGKVKTGQNADITCAAVGSKVFVGKVSFVSPSAKVIVGMQGSRTMVEATIDIQETDGLKSGYSAVAEILTEHKTNSVIVPFDAMSQYNGKTGVWKEKDGYAYFTPVNTGVELELETEIKEGLKGGERIIISPPKNILNGTRVEVGR